MTESVRLVCPFGRKRAELWGGAALAALGLATAALTAASWAGVALGILLAGAGGALIWHAALLRAPVLEVGDGEFRYVRGRYIVRLPFSEIGSYYVLPGRTRSLGLCDTAGRPRVFPSVEGRRANRPYLPLTGLTSPGRVDTFMSTAGIPQRDRSLTSGAT
ncbi:hypothetical protein CLV63_112135 [Murinocardiopsis flavida]|uniref:PH (Pleckstrin Homology) domain-containing protein n=1 Tax=Murinocardiopsis flavida TaxID=645275 RepID=A0A2P8DGB1_9ACTN|nr:hypothetical protein [Murinocardiopsis flavida]PSK96252.1 hypothetical protein CLV63_112135 [Murinocardiopsis flavida]